MKLGWGPQRASGRVNNFAPSFIHSTHGLRGPLVRPLMLIRLFLSVARRTAASVTVQPHQSPVSSDHERIQFTLDHFQHRWSFITQIRWNNHPSEFSGQPATQITCNRFINVIVTFVVYMITTNVTLKRWWNVCIYRKIVNIAMSCILPPKVPQNLFFECYFKLNDVN